MLQLYRALIIQQLEYAAAVWQIGDCGVLENVQRKGLGMCLGVPGTVGIEAARIMMKPDDSNLKVSWDSFLDKESAERKISPFGKMNVQVVDMITNTGISYTAWRRNLVKALVKFARKLLCFTHDLDTKHQRLF